MTRSSFFWLDFPFFDIVIKRDFCRQLFKKSRFLFAVPFVSDRLVPHRILLMMPLILAPSNAFDFWLIDRSIYLLQEIKGFNRELVAMFSRIFGKPKQETNALATIDKLNEVRFLFYGIADICACVLWQLWYRSSVWTLDLRWSCLLLQCGWDLCLFTLGRRFWFIGRCDYSA